ncbi:DEAD-box ATP-dependent RNA helicase 37 [Beta vulgaris subsp. vulgaris]|uniref:DEAD-box ATP-dependent RNA helicase 37 n=1 Tax=Beta vulgaris subsp. vulgaris TaxID=3555 RepID=UPI002036BDC7|nr:DEAD-box ATP-dependent RNA helicase 37 [Beta vulgaris subsp. vulgaris]
MAPWTNYDFPSLTSSPRPSSGSTRFSSGSTRFPSGSTRSSSGFSGSHSNHRGGSHRGGRGGSRGWWGQVGGGSGSGEKFVDDEPNPFIEEVCEKFDELEVIEESNEIAKNLKNESNMINFDAYEDIPVEVSGENVPKPVTTFGEIDLGKALNENIKRCKYVKPTPIQRHAIPIVMDGRDLMACAQTGSGKTAAFCFPIIAGILKRVPPYRPPLSRGSSASGGGSGRMICPVSLIMSPTRELSSQIHDEAKKFAYQTGVKVAVAYGGTPMADQLRKLAKGVDILVATPGRLVDMIERGKVSLRMVRYLALDEADRMLDMGFEPQIRKIVQQMDMPPPGSRQTMLFSATFPTEIQRLASDFLKNYIFLTVGKVGSSTDLIEQKVEFVADYNKRQHLKDLLMSQKMNGTNGKQALTIVFVETKRGVDDLEYWLSSNGFPATAIHGDKVQWERERALKSFKSGATPIIVATDVAARGLDIPCVAHVINFDLPRDIDDYVHRIGRTGRAGNSGLATAFFNDKNLGISKALIEIMEDSHQEVPSWLAEYAGSSSYHESGGGSSGARRSRGGKFGGRDYRSFNQASNGYSGYSDYSNTYSAQVPSAEPFIDTSAADSCNTPEYRLTHGYESIVASGWE